MTHADEIAAGIDDRWDFDDPAATEQAFRSWLDEPATTADAELHGQLLTQVARTMSLQRRFEEAHALLDEVETLAEDRLLLTVRYLLERGRTLNSSGRADEARPLFIEAWERASGVGADFYAIDAAHMIAIVESPDNALAWNRRALDTARVSADERARNWEGSLSNNLGWTCHGSGEFDVALQHFERALAARKRQGRTGEIRVARWSIGRCLRSLTQLDEALNIQLALLAEHEAGGTTDGYVHEEIAECLDALGRPDAARPHFGRAHELLSADPWLVDNEAARLQRLADRA
jgi:tetratricopeptide (TPR) repeat protein